MTIAGGECLACGLVYAPAQSFGCERCGASGHRLRTRELSATGTVISRAVVHVHRFPTPTVPFTVLEVALAAGPVVRGLASDGNAQANAVGAAVVGRVEGDEGLLRFASADGRGAA